MRTGSSSVTMTRNTSGETSELEAGNILAALSSRNHSAALGTELAGVCACFAPRFDMVFAPIAYNRRPPSTSEDHGSVPITRKYTTVATHP